MDSVEANGFQFSITSITASASVSYNKPWVDRRIEMRTQCRDAVGNRVVAFAWGVALDEVRDERGRNLLRFVDRRNPPEYSPQMDPDRFTAFIERHQLDSGNYKTSITRNCSLDGLPSLPRRLKILRGHLNILEATKLTTVDVPLRASETWIEIAPGLRLRVDAVIAGERGLEVRCLMESDRTHDWLDHVQHQRWYWIEFIDADGRLKQGVSGVPKSIQGASGRWFHTIPTSPQQAAPAQLRVTVIEEMEVFTLPFEYRNVQVQ